MTGRHNASGTHCRNLLRGRFALMAVIAISILPSACSSDHQSGEALSTTKQPIQQPPADCTSGEFNGHEYRFCSAPLPFDAARAACSLLGMDLVNVDDAGENGYVLQNLTSDSYIGITDREREGAWRWIAENRLAWCAEPDVAQPGAYANWTAPAPAAPDCHYLKDQSTSYWFCPNHETWTGARKACDSAGMRLAAVRSQSENEFISMHGPTAMWIGGSDALVAGDWRWVGDHTPFWTGGSSGSAVNGAFTWWNSGAPHDNDVLNCTKMMNGHWHTSPCLSAAGFVCSARDVLDPQKPDARDCATMDQESGSWKAVECSTPAAYVCETPTQPAGSTKLNKIANSG